LYFVSIIVVCWEVFLMSHEIDLGGPAAAESLRIADALLREVYRGQPLPELIDSGGADVLYQRVKNIGALAELLLRSLAFSAVETNEAIAKKLNPDGGV
jgi:hypothetical protein